MSQYYIFKILEELGGAATTEKIRDLAKKNYPNKTLHKYVLNRLKKLEKIGAIRKRSGDVWIIVKEIDWKRSHKRKRFG